MKHFFYLLLMVIVVSSCQDEFSETSLIIPEIPGPTIRVEADVFGRVFDENGQPVQGVEVDFAGQINPSNSNGFFLFESANSNRIGEVITLEQDGFFPGIRRINPLAGSVNTADFQLLSNIPTHQFPSNESFTINLDEGLSLVFPPNAVATQNGDPFNGTVNVALHFIDPTAEDINELLPGSLQGVTFEQELVTLLSYGMLVAELTDDAGRELQVRDGQTVRWIQTIPPSLLSSAPDQVPLWSLDEATGLWIEEGVSIKQGDTYVSELSHFSYWNIDDPNDFVTIEGSVDAPFATIQFVDNNGNIRQRKQVDATGGFTAFIPIGESITLIFLDECGEEIGRREVGPFDVDTNIGSLDFTSNIDEVTIVATVVDCNGDLLENGFLLINDRIYINVENGQVNESIILCDEQDINLLVLNSDFSLTSEAISVPFDIQIELSDIVVCEENEQSDFVRFVITNMATNEEIEYVFTDFSYHECSLDDMAVTIIDGEEVTTFSSSFRTGIFGEPNGQEQLTNLSFTHGQSCDIRVDEIEIADIIFFVVEDGLDVFYAVGGVMGSINEFGQQTNERIRGSLTSNNVVRVLWPDGESNEDSSQLRVDGVFNYTIK